MRRYFARSIVRLVLLSTVVTASVAVPVSAAVGPDSTETEFDLPDSDSPSSDASIIGGTEAFKGEYPFMGQIKNCGIALVHPEYAVTAAHCFVGDPDFDPQNPDLKVTFGHHDQSDPAQGVVVDAVEIVRHHKYRTSAPGAYDIAVVKIDPPVEAPVYMQLSEERPPHTEAIIVGWGQTQHGAQEDTAPDVLLKATVPLHSDEYCNVLIQEQYDQRQNQERAELREKIFSLQSSLDQLQKYFFLIQKIIGLEKLQELIEGATESLQELQQDLDEVEDIYVADRYIDPIMFCAGGDGVDTCQGDSGGPIFVNRPNGPVSIGVVSWGVGCGGGGVYTELHGNDIYGWLYGQLPREVFFDCTVEFGDTGAQIAWDDAPAYFNETNIHKNSVLGTSEEPYMSVRGFTSYRDAGADKANTYWIQAKDHSGALGAKRLCRTV